MPFNVNDRVRITEDRDFGQDHVAKGAAGKVTQVAPTGDAYWVKFDNMNRDVLVGEEILEPG